MIEKIREYTAVVDAEHRIKLQSTGIQAYTVREFSDGRILMEPGIRDSSQAGDLPEAGIPARDPFWEFLATIPNVGDDSDFVRDKDYGRPVDLGSDSQT